jgi:pimeloyl-ACP methyl ester carboxylesterase
MRIKVLALTVLAEIVLGLGIRAEQPPRTLRMPANGTSLAYVEQGKGTPVVFAHGAVGDLRLWEPQRQDISRGHRFVTYTYRYHGLDPWPDDGKQYTRATHAADLAALIGGLKSGPVHLVGLSYGGFVASLVAMNHPQLVRSLTLADASLFTLLADRPEDKAALDAFVKGTEPLMAALKTGDAAGATKQLVALVLNRTPKTFDELPEGLRQILMDNARTLPLLFAEPEVVISCDMLRQVKIPTLVVGGAESPAFFTATNDAIVRCISGSRLHIVPKAGHVMTSDNAPEFNKALLEFIARHQ